jgi:hypothetical protein
MMANSRSRRQGLAEPEACGTKIGAQRTKNQRRASN